MLMFVKSYPRKCINDIHILTIPHLSLHFHFICIMWHFCVCKFCIYFSTVRGEGVRVCCSKVWLSRRQEIGICWRYVLLVAFLFYFIFYRQMLVCFFCWLLMFVQMLRTFLLWLFLFGCAEKHFPSSSEVGDVKTWDRFFFTKFLAPASGDEYLLIEQILF